MELGVMTGYSIKLNSDSGAVADMHSATSGRQTRSVRERNLAITQQRDEKTLYLAKLHVAWLPITKLPPLPPISITGHKVQAGTYVL